jgi:hypothetical protein
MIVFVIDMKLTHVIIFDNLFLKLLSLSTFLSQRISMFHKLLVVKIEKTNMTLIYVVIFNNLFFKIIISIDM